MKAVASNDWQSYWQQAGSKGVCELGGTDHPAIRQFWHNFFTNVEKEESLSQGHLCLLDVASGGGAVFEHALEVFPPERITPVSVDLSPAAVKACRSRWQQVRGVVADAAALPFPNNSVDIAVSQFGIEYAGHGAIMRLLRTVKPSGKIAFLIHFKDGAIFRECADNYSAIRKVQEIGFVEGALEMFACAFDVLEGADRERYESTSRNLIPAFRAMEDIMQQFGQHVAGDTVRRLYLDVDHIHTNLPRFSRGDVDSWLRRALAELESYAGRMHSMCNAALGAEELQELIANIEQCGFDKTEIAPIQSADVESPLAWSVVMKKS